MLSVREDVARVEVWLEMDVNGATVVLVVSVVLIVVCLEDAAEVGEDVSVEESIVKGVIDDVGVDDVECMVLSDVEAPDVTNGAVDCVVVVGVLVVAELSALVVDVAEGALVVVECVIPAVLSVVAWLDVEIWEIVVNGADEDEGVVSMAVEVRVVG